MQLKLSLRTGIRAIAIVVATFSVGWASYLQFSNNDQSHTFEALNALCMDDSADPNVVIDACTQLMLAENASPARIASLNLKRAWANKRGGNLDRALSDVSESIRLEPHNPLPWVYRAYINDALSSESEVLSDIANARRLAPDDPNTLARIARFNFKRGDLERSLGDYRELLRKKPDDKYASQYEIAILIKLEQYDAATDRLQRHLELWPDHYSAHRTLGLLHLYHTKDMPKALSAFSTLADLKPHEIDKYLFPAMVYFASGEDQRGQDLITKLGRQLASETVNNKSLSRQLLEKINTNASAESNEELVFKAIGFALAGQKEQARASFDEYLEFGGGHAAVHLGDIIDSAGVDVDASQSPHSQEHLDRKIDNYIKYLEHVWSFDNMKNLL